MVIGIDIDDTIALTSDKLLEKALVFDKEVLNGYGIKNKDAYRFVDKFNWTSDEVKKFFDSLDKGELYNDLEPISDAEFYINKLYDEGNEIIFITRRADFTEIRVITENWLREKGFKYNKLVLGSLNKGESCLKYNVDFYIDDVLSNVLSATSYGVNAVIFGKITNDEVKNFDSWRELYKYINEVKR